ncbi:hypothetical protein BKA69DRAFT_1173952 [Paraphysoderma sedebokerense]|nr:hypothetical protein BKA69DRAFT_1173952 [Paraphysoderma sedebokerense]
MTVYMNCGSILFLILAVLKTVLTTDVEFFNRIYDTRIRTISEEQRNNACSSMTINGKGEIDGLKACEFQLIGWHGTAAKNIEAIQNGIELKVDLENQYERRLGVGFYTADSAERAGFFADTQDPAICAIYAPTRLFQEWPKIYMPLFYEVEPLMRGGSNKRIHLHFFTKQHNLYLRLLKHYRYVPLETSDSKSVLWVSGIQDDPKEPRMQMVVPPEYFPHIKAECVPTRLKSELTGYFDLNWRENLVKRRMIYNYPNVLQTIDRKTWNRL